MHHIHFKEIPSTNTWIKENLHKIPNSGILWVTADRQTAGRGRHGKSWISQEGEGLLLSYGYWASINDEEQLLSLQIAKNLSKLFTFLGLNTTVKPPNDILVNEKKLCGVLCETAWDQDRLAHIVGIGINVTGSPQQLDQETTSLKEEGIDISVSDLFEKLSQYFRVN